MKSKLIRILIVFCFVGMVIFGVVVFLSNHNVESKVYTEITKIKNNADFESLYKDANSVQSTYGSSVTCGYVDYANDAIKFLNEGIDYYLYYFQDMSGMNKKEKDAVLTKYKDYIAAINSAKKTLNKYESFESKLSPTISDQTTMSALSAMFAQDYLRAYAKGYEVFVELQNLVDKKIFGGKMFKSFTQVKYEMAANFVCNSINSVVAKLGPKTEDGASLPYASPYGFDKNAQNFNYIYNYKKLTDGYELREQNHAQFLINYNKISNPRAFLSDSTTYIATNSDEATYCTAVKTFLGTTYGTKF